MNTQLAEVTGQLHANTRRAQEIVAKAGESRLSLRPREDTWSIAECIAHLTISTRIYIPRWQTALAHARKANLQANGPFRLELMGRAFKWLLEPPARLKFKVPPGFDPAEIGPPEQVLPDFVAAQDAFLAVVAESDGFALDRIKIPSPASDRLRFNMWSSFCLIAAHQRRHLWQAERVLSQ